MKQCDLCGEDLTDAVDNTEENEEFYAEFPDARPKDEEDTAYICGDCMQFMKGLLGG